MVEDRVPPEPPRGSLERYLGYGMVADWRDVLPPDEDDEDKPKAEKESKKGLV